jgi:hypothetical protein
MPYNKLHHKHSYILGQMGNTDQTQVPYILESNPHSGFGDFLKGKKLVRGSNPHLSFKHPSPTGWLTE